MIKLILRMLFLLCIVSIFIWLNFVHNKITIEFDQLLITTTLVRFLIALFGILIPIILITKTYGTIKSFFFNNFYIHSIVNNLDLINSQRDKDFLSYIILHSNKAEHLNYFKALNKALADKDFIKLQKTLNKAKLPKNLQHIIDFYQAMIDLEHSDQINAIEVCKKYVNTKHKFNEYFAVELCKYALEKSNYQLCEYLIAHYSNINFNAENKLKYYALIQYKLAKQYISTNNMDLALDIINKVIKKYPHFAPIYDLQCKILVTQKDQKSINKLLENIWKKYPSYDNIILYTTYYQPLDKKDINTYIANLKNSSKNENLNLLLSANLYIRFDKLIQAQQCLDLVKNTYADFIKIQLLSKEGNYQELLSLIKQNYIKSDSFWNNYI